MRTPRRLRSIDSQRLQLAVHLSRLRQFSLHLRCAFLRRFSLQTFLRHIFAKCDGVSGSGPELLRLFLNSLRRLLLDFSDLLLLLFLARRTEPLDQPASSVIELGRQLCFKSSLC